MEFVPMPRTHVFAKDIVFCDEKALPASNLVFRCPHRGIIGSLFFGERIIDSL